MLNNSDGDASASQIVIVDADAVVSFLLLMHLNGVCAV